MDNTDSSIKSYKIHFYGDGNSYFGIMIVNWLLTMITLGFYYPWAKAKQLQYLYGATSLNDNRFVFSGTGREMFKGFLKALAILCVLFGVFLLFIYLFKMLFTGLLLFYAGIFAIVPIAIHGSYRYRMSRTSWRGIRFGYRGDRNELLKNFLRWIFFTIITIGIYGAWLKINLRNYVLSNVRLGNMKFKYKGDGGDYLVLNLKGYFFTIFTLGIYFFWWSKELFEYYVNNLVLQKDDQQINIKSIATGGGFFKLYIINLLLIIFTLGLAYPWAVTRTINFIFSNIELEGDIDLDTLTQSEDVYNDATGEDITDFLNIDLIV